MSAVSWDEVTHTWRVTLADTRGTPRTFYVSGVEAYRRASKIGDVSDRTQRNAAVVIACDRLDEECRWHADALCDVPARRAS